MKKLIIGITMGDPASIGPEITAKVLSKKAVYEKCNPIVIGDAAVMQAALRLLGQDNTIQIHAIQHISEALYTYGTIDVLDMRCVDLEKLQIGTISAMAGEASFQYVKKVIELALDGEVDATVTNAFSKEAINIAGHQYSGHTELYAHETGVKKYAMMLIHEDLRVVHVSTHVSLREACDRVTQERVLKVIRLANDACLALGITHPKIGVAGLNPHSGENGLFGREEIEEIIPAIEQATQEGLQVEGPVPPDTIYSKARGGWYDVVVAMYHDQGHIPLKVLGFVYDKEEQRWAEISGVNITLGLPIVRVSVDHGTAFDYAGTGKASELSLEHAINYSILLGQNAVKIEK